MSRFETLLSAKAEIVGHAKILAAPAYEKLLRSERPLRRSIPVLIILFLAIAAVARLASLVSERYTIENDVARDLKIAATLMRAESQFALMSEGRVDGAALLTSEVPSEVIEHGRFAVISDASGRITAAMPGYERLIGRDLRLLMGDSQALLMFGERAGVQETVFEGNDAFVASATLAEDAGTVSFIQPAAELFASWRQSVHVNVTLFVLTSVIMLMVLYAYFRQATRAEDADALYLETHLRVDTALSRGHCGLWDWDIGRGRMYWSRSMYEILGMAPKDDVLSFGEIAPLLHPQDGSLFDVARRVASGRIGHLDRVFRMRHSDGNYVWLRARADVTRCADNEVHLIGIAVDVSEQQELARRSDEANEQLNSAIENISETFVLCDNRDRVILCNSKYRETFGLTEADVARGTPLETVMAKARRPIDSQLVTSPTFAAGERASEALLPDGRWLLMSERRTTDGGFVSIGTDVTQLKLHQARLSDSERRLIAVIEDLSTARRDAERKAGQLTELNTSFAAEKERAETASRAKTTFLANMSHELRTPLNAILGFSEIMRDGTFGPIGCQKYTEYCEDIHQSGHYLLRLINDILDMAKIEAGRLILNPEEVDLAETVAEAMKIVAIQAEQKQLTLTVAAPETLQIRSDRRATKQILINLLSNAVKFTEQGGSVRLGLKQVGDAVLISIGDDGIGIPQEALRTLGRPFEQIENEWTRTNKGTGLGLAIARSLVELHGGRMRISSRVGAGTIVALRLPVEGFDAGEGRDVAIASAA
ncbi:PAS domain-containing sensor histidine kinase [Aurantimonas endophytica]|uniref:histidine kinase n=1 Tax=Aurantimonas endophytica TaxID=1522175 RepID=A0A7W6MQQ9_9HYPH|nr:PAS domain-containing sensor histidine kinase [Aurantimonas endophytica]MBB4004232.1 two-component system cell cycle sensor histidine kinase PleC [Aurantimonas endophytica]